MKKLSRKAREHIVRQNIQKRRKRSKRPSGYFIRFAGTPILNSQWLKKLQKERVEVETIKGNRVFIHLPEIMNFSSNFEQTTRYINAIRLLVVNGGKRKGQYHLGGVRFKNLRKISTSAALVLTAELSKWDDRLIKDGGVKPFIEEWDKSILQQFYEIGFFTLFDCDDRVQLTYQEEIGNPLKLVRYMKGSCNDSEKTRLLKEKLFEIVGDNISKWTFLHSGLNEAITNVSHHAYPEEANNLVKKWYLTGSYSENTKELKIVFYDQGVGIPKTLPGSNIWQKITGYLSSLDVPSSEKANHKSLLKAAMQLDRTRTKEDDRGKGLPDLLEFIKQRKNGYMSVLSLFGLYKFTSVNGIESTKSESLRCKVPGTLLIWCVKLTED